MKNLEQKNPQWAIFYRSPKGEIMACATHLGCAYVNSTEVNVYCDDAKLQEIYKQTIAYTKRSERAPEGSGHARWEGWLKPEYRNGTVFIARVGSKDFPAKLTREPRFQDDAPEYPKDKLVWSLRVPCELIQA
jgi:hypothetical protein